MNSAGVGTQPDSVTLSLYQPTTEPERWTGGEGQWTDSEKEASWTTGYRSDAGKPKQCLSWNKHPSEVLVLSPGPEAPSSLTILYDPAALPRAAYRSQTR